MTAEEEIRAAMDKVKLAKEIARRERTACRCCGVSGGTSFVEKRMRYECLECYEELELGVIPPFDQITGGRSSGGRAGPIEGEGVGAWQANAVRYLEDG